MSKAMRVCPVPGCPTKIPAGATACPPHQREREHRRGSRQHRGYDAAHDTLRRRWRDTIDTAPPGRPVLCARCGKPITKGQPFDLGHTDDRTTHTGPEHVYCNRSAAGRARHAKE